MTNKNEKLINRTPPDETTHLSEKEVTELWEIIHHYQRERDALLESIKSHTQKNNTNPKPKSKASAKSLNGTRRDLISRKIKSELKKYKFFRFLNEIKKKLI